MDINFLDCLTIMTLGKSKPKYTWQSLTIWMFLVLNNFTKKRSTGKSKDLRSDLVSGQISRPYTRTGIHLLLISWIYNFFRRNSTYPVKYYISCLIKGTFYVIKIALKYTGFDKENSKISHLINPRNWVPGGGCYLSTTYIVTRADS